MNETEIRESRKIIGELCRAVPELTDREKAYLRKLITRDMPTYTGTYRGTVDGQEKTFLCCGECRTRLRAPSEKRKAESSRFCPACGTRIRWPENVLAAAGKTAAQEAAGIVAQPATEGASGNVAQPATEGTSGNVAQPAT